MIDPFFPASWNVKRRVISLKNFWFLKTHQSSDPMRLINLCFCLNGLFIWSLLWLKGVLLCLDDFFCFSNLSFEFIYFYLVIWVCMVTMWVVDKILEFFMLGLLDCIWDFKFEVMGLYVGQVFLVGVECRGCLFGVVWEFWCLLVKWRKLMFDLLSARWQLMWFLWMFMTVENYRCSWKNETLRVHYAKEFDSLWVCERILKMILGGVFEGMWIC